MTPLEKAARALLASESNGEKPWDDLDAITRGAFLRDARAVLQAIREPSEAMVSAAAPHVFDQSRMSAECAWQAAIDAALTE
jgi:hypothetical protein